jgi:hypothetical protein
LGSIDTTSMNMMMRVSSTSIKGVTLICGLDEPPPAMEKAIGEPLLSGARVCCIRHLGDCLSSTSRRAMRVAAVTRKVAQNHFWAPEIFLLRAARIRTRLGCSSLR